MKSLTRNRLRNNVPDTCDRESMATNTCLETYRHHAFLVIGVFFLFASCCLQLVSTQAFAQERGSMRGKVIDSATKEGLVGVNVIIKGTYYGATTDLEGNYEIKNVSHGI